MTKLTMTLVAAVIVTITSCQKEEFTSPESNLKTELTDCKRCDGDWDLNDTTIVNP